MYSKTPKEHGYKLFSKYIKGKEISPVLVFTGEEEFLVDWAVNSVVSKYVNSGVRDFDFLRLEDEAVEVGDIIENCETFSMFSEKRVVWVRDFAPLKNSKAKGWGADSLEKLGQYVQNPNSNTILILTATYEKSEKPIALGKNIKPYVEEFIFDKLDKVTLRGFIVNRLKNYGMEISERALDTLVNETGYFNRETEYRLFNLENDLKKLRAYSKEKIKEEHIYQLLMGDMDTFIFSFTDAVSQGDKNKAFFILHNILRAGGDVYQILGTLVSNFEIILQMAEFRDEGKSLSEVKSIVSGNPYRLEKAYKSAGSFRVEKLRNILVQLYEVDRNIKTGLLEPELALELVIGRM